MALSCLSSVRLRNSVTKGGKNNLGGHEWHVSQRFITTLRRDKHSGYLALRTWTHNTSSLGISVVIKFQHCSLSQKKWVYAFQIFRTQLESKFVKAIALAPELKHEQAQRLMRCYKAVETFRAQFASSLHVLASQPNFQPPYSSLWAELPGVTLNEFS